MISCCSKLPPDQQRANAIWYDLRAVEDIERTIASVRRWRSRLLLLRGLVTAVLVADAIVLALGFSVGAWNVVTVGKVAAMTSLWLLRNVATGTANGQHQEIQQLARRRAATLERVLTIDSNGARP